MKTSHIQMVLFFGIFIGAFCLGSLSDRYVTVHEHVLHYLVNLRWLYPYVYYIQYECVYDDNIVV